MEAGTVRLGLNRDNEGEGALREPVPLSQLSKTGGVIDIHVHPDDKLAPQEDVGEEPHLVHDFAAAEDKKKNNFYVESKQWDKSVDLQNGRFRKVRQKDQDQAEDSIQEQVPVIAEENFETEMTEALRKCTICLQKFFTFFIGAIVGMSAIQLFILVELSSSEYSAMAVGLSALLNFFTTINAIGSANFLIVRIQQSRSQEQEGRLSPQTKKLKILAWFVLIFSSIAYVVTLYQPMRATPLAFENNNLSTTPLLAVSAIRLLFLLASWILTILGLQWAEDTIDFVDLDEETDVGDKDDKF